MQYMYIYTGSKRRDAKATFEKNLSFFYWLRLLQAGHTAPTSSTRIRSHIPAFLNNDSPLLVGFSYQKRKVLANATSTRHHFLRYAQKKHHVVVNGQTNVIRFQSTECGTITLVYLRLTHVDKPRCCSVDFLTKLGQYSRGFVSQIAKIVERLHYGGARTHNREIKLPTLHCTLFLWRKQDVVAPQVQ